MRTIVSIAPSYEMDLETLSPEVADSLLILYGSHDEDVINEVGIGSKPYSPFRLFDQTWIDYAGRSVKQKAMVLYRIS